MICFVVKLSCIYTKVKMKRGGFMKKIISIALTLVTAFSLTACGGENETVQSVLTASATTPADTAVTTGGVSEASLQSFSVSDFIAEPDNRITKATGGRAFKLTAIPSFTDADKHFYPSTDDYCLMCYPATVYLENVESEIHIAKLDLISFDVDGKVETHYQAFVFETAEEAEKYHEFRKTRDGVKYRELYAGSSLTESIMVGCAKRYDNIIYFNMGFQTVGMEEAYNKSYLAGEQSFYEGIGYSFLYSVEDCTSDPYGHYEWAEEDNEYFYPTSPRFLIAKYFCDFLPDGNIFADNVLYTKYVLCNYDEFGKIFSQSIKYELADEAAAAAFLDVTGAENAVLGSFGRYVYDIRNASTAETESNGYYFQLGEEYMEWGQIYADNGYPVPGMGDYYFFSYRDKECPTEVTASKITANAPIEELKPKDETKTVNQGTGSWEAYFCSEETDEVLNKPSCEMFIGKDGDEAIIHIYEYKGGVTVYESETRGDFDKLFTPQEVGIFESDNLTDPVDEIGEYMLTTVDRDNIVLSADYGTVVLDFLLTRAEHTVQG